MKSFEKDITTKSEKLKEDLIQLGKISGSLTEQINTQNAVQGRAGSEALKAQEDKGNEKKQKEGARKGTEAAKEKAKEHRDIAFAAK